MQEDMANYSCLCTVDIKTRAEGEKQSRLLLIIFPDNFTF
jgi:hypothetical protein